MDRAYGYVMPENIDENGSIMESSAEGFLEIDCLLNLGTGYHSFPRLEFVDAQSVGFQNGSGASWIVLEDGKIQAIKMINSGRGYSKYKKLSGTVRFGKEPDLLVGINTDFL